MLGAWLGFEALLRPGEVCNLTAGDFTLPQAGWSSEAEVGVVVAIRRPKTRRVWRTQFALVKDTALIAWLRWWLEERSGRKAFLRMGRRDWAHLLGSALEELDLHDRGFTLGSLRGGGATHLFRVTENIARLQYAGRWARQETVKSYLQEALATQVLTSATPSAQEKLNLVHGHVHRLRHPPPTRLSVLFAQDSQDE